MKILFTAICYWVFAKVGFKENNDFLMQGGFMVDSMQPIPTRKRQIWTSLESFLRLKTYHRIEKVYDFQMMGSRLKYLGCLEITNNLITC